MPRQDSAAHSTAVSSPKYPLVLDTLCALAAFPVISGCTWGGDGAGSPKIKALGTTSCYSQYRGHCEQQPVPRAAPGMCRLRGQVALKEKVVSLSS